MFSACAPIQAPGGPTVTPLHSAFDEPQHWINPVDGAEYIFIPAGSFLMGVNHVIAADCNRLECASDREEYPQHEVFLDDFWIMRTEVTLAQYQKCIEARACASLLFPIEFLPPEQMAEIAQRPVFASTWQNAHDYAKWVGGQLPSEAEWEKACRGTDGRTYPWGDEPPVPGQIAKSDLQMQDDFLSSDLGQWFVSTMSPGFEQLQPPKDPKGTLAFYSGFSPVGAHPHDRSIFGVLDTAGNVGEYTRSLPLSYPYRADDGRELTTESPDIFHVIRGNSPRCAGRFSKPVMLAELSTGFRVMVKEPG
jgi:formylglycine-generating enzyme required for sulfatase activity